MTSGLFRSAVGQKKRLVRDGINAYDVVQVRVDFDNGMSINFHNNWMTPPDFEGPVNQGHEIVGTDGKVESDQQYRGFRWWNKGGEGVSADLREGDLNCWQPHCPLCGRLQLSGYASNSRSGP